MLLKNLKTLFIKFVLPVLAFIYISVRFNVLIAIAFAGIYIAFTLYKARASVFASIGKWSYVKGDMDKAVRWFRKAYRTGKAKPETVISFGYLLLKSGNVESCEKVLDNLLVSKLESDDEMLAKSNLALVLWKKGDLDGAIAMLEEVFDKYKTSTVYGSLGYLLILKGDLERALAFNLEAYEYNNSNTVILDNLGQTYYLMGNINKAEEIYEKLIEANPTYPGAYYNYGLVFESKGELDKALETMEKALKYKVTFLSAVTQEEIDSKISELKEKINK